MSKLPEGFHLKETEVWGQLLVRDDQRESFRLTDRPFDREVDHDLGYLPSRIIKYLLGKNSTSPVDILDIGGGRLSTSAAEIVNTFGPRVRMTNLELMESVGDIPKGVNYMVGDVCNMERIPTGSIHFAYSYEVLPHFEDEAKQERALEEISRVLAPAGVGLIMDRYFSRMPLTDPTLTQFGIKNGVFIIRKQGNGIEKGRIGFGPLTQFLMIVKEPIDYVLLSLQSRIVGHY